MYIKFLDSKTPIKCAVKRISENVVELRFDDEIIVNQSGFRAYKDKECEYDIGGNSYERYTTMYRNDETTIARNGYQLSNNDTVYIPPTPKPTPEPEPYVPTLEEVKQNKINEMNAIQQLTIQNGLDITLSDGTVEHFTLTDHDQTSLMGLQTKVLAGDEKIPWHDSDISTGCKYYSNADMAIITEKAMAFVMWHVTYFINLRVYILALETKEEVENIEYGTYIPEEYQDEVMRDLYALA